MSKTLTASDFEMKYDAKHTFPFIETEDAVVMAYGHQDRFTFVALLKQYDDLCNGRPIPDDEATTAPEVRWVYAVQEQFEWEGEYETDWYVRWSDVTAETPGAFPLTVVLR